MMREELAIFMESIKRVLSSAVDLIILNVLLIICCIPVITAGAAWVACYAYLLRIVRGIETSFPFKPFFVDFRKVFKKATISFLLLMACLLILAGDYFYAVYVADPVNKFFMIFSIVLAIVLLLAAMWLFPLIARFENTVRGSIKNAFLMAVAEFPRTIFALLITILIVALPLLIPELFIYLGWIWVMFGFSAPMYFTARLFRKQLDCIPKKIDENEQD